MSFEMVVDGLAVIGAGTCLWVGITGLGRLLGWIERSEIERQAAEAAAARATPAAAPAAPRAPVRTADAGSDLSGDLVAAISAAVAALGDGMRVVHISEPATGHAWAAEGRWMHQTSHRTH
jgi:hypothetical protein